LIWRRQPRANARGVREKGNRSGPVLHLAVFEEDLSCDCEAGSRSEIQREAILSLGPGNHGGLKLLR